MRKNGFTLAEVLVGAGLGAVILSVLASFFVGLNALQRIQSEVSEISRQQEVMGRELKNLFRRTNSAAVFLSDDSRKLSIQGSNSVSSGGATQWDNELTLFFFDDANARIGFKFANLVALGLTPSLDRPASLMNPDLEAFATFFTDRVKYTNHVAECSFQLDKPRLFFTYDATCQIDKKRFRFKKGFSFLPSHE